jgi:hypothetical protein
MDLKEWSNIEREREKKERKRKTDDEALGK